MHGSRAHDYRSTMRWEPGVADTTAVATMPAVRDVEVQGQRSRADARPDADVWAVVLAGGQGVRLRALTEYVCGDSRPKQFARLLGRHSLLRQTLERTALGIPWARTVVVAHRHHAGYLAAELGGRTDPYVLLQPEDRGTGAAILLAAHSIAARQPDAIVAVFPSDHFIRGETAFMHHVLAVATHVRRHAGPIVLLGVVATDAESQYGWIRLGPVLGRVGGEPLNRVASFSEKPSPAAARAACGRGDLWSTFVLVGSVHALVSLGWQAVPMVSERLAEVRRAVTADGETAAMASAYAQIPSVDFSRGILERQSSLLTVSRIPASIVWSDWGTLERVVTSLRAAGLVPGWMRDLDRGAPLTVASTPD
jgi:mannose-1-phosphate guanylyltransferase